MKERLPFSKKIAYAMGQFGWSLASYGAANFLTQFYLPFNEGGHAAYPTMIYQGYVVGVLTIIGMALGFGRVFDAVTDPLVAVLSDSCGLKLGKRRSFLAISVLPFALFSALVFIPIAGAGPGANLTLNSLWLFISITLLYWFMTMYVTPYYAWMSELGHDADERLELSTMISVTWALGAILGSQAPLLQSLLQARGMSAISAFQIVMACLSGLALIFMLLPIIFIDENRYCEGGQTDEGFFSAIAKVIKDRNFLIFTVSDLAYWISLYLINNGLQYYITVLLGLPKSLYSLLSIVTFGVSFLFYVPVGMLAKKVGRRVLLIAAFILFALTFAYCSLFGRLPLGAQTQAWIAAVLAALPLAVFGILPNAMISDMAEAYAIETGLQKAGVFFGFRTFMSKMGQFVGALVMPSIIMIGANSQAGEKVGAFGVRLTTYIAFGFCLLGLCLLLAYNEKKVMRSLAKRGANK
jgi:Na+/melibiose symporter-like transporter